MDKDKRQTKILGLIRARRIGTQQELAAGLERAGIEATQSSVSRDLEELGIVKRRRRYVLPQARSNGDGGAALTQGLLSLDAAGECLVVAKCEPGHASAVAVTIDGADIPEIVGTLAGEDTVFIAITERKARRVAIKKVWELF